MTLAVLAAIVVAFRILFMYSRVHFPPDATQLRNPFARHRAKRLVEQCSDRFLNTPGAELQPLLAKASKSGELDAAILLHLVVREYRDGTLTKERLIAVGSSFSAVPLILPGRMGSSFADRDREFLGMAEGLLQLEGGSVDRLPSEGEAESAASPQSGQHVHSSQSSGDFDSAPGCALEERAAELGHAANRSGAGIAKLILSNLELKGKRGHETLSDGSLDALTAECVAVQLHLTAALLRRRSRGSDSEAEIDTFIPQMQAAAKSEIIADFLAGSRADTDLALRHGESCIAAALAYDVHTSAIEEHFAHDAEEAVLISFACRVKHILTEVEPEDSMDAGLLALRFVLDD